MKQENRGGARPGAGRKSADPQRKRVQMVVTVKPETKEILRTFSRERHIRPGRLIDELVTGHWNLLEEECGI